MDLVILITRGAINASVGDSQDPQSISRLRAACLLTSPVARNCKRQGQKKKAPYQELGLSGRGVKVNAWDLPSPYQYLTGVGRRIREV
jgi:hypothetical protein